MFVKGVTNESFCVTQWLGSVVYWASGQYIDTQIFKN